MKGWASWAGALLLEKIAATAKAAAHIIRVVDFIGFTFVAFNVDFPKSVESIMVLNFEVLIYSYEMYQFGVFGDGYQYIARGVSHSASPVLTGLEAVPSAMDCGSQKALVLAERALPSHMAKLPILL